MSSYAALIISSSCLFLFLSCILSILISLLFLSLLIFSFCNALHLVEKDNFKILVHRSTKPFKKHCIRLANHLITPLFFPYKERKDLSKENYMSKYITKMPIGMILSTGSDSMFQDIQTDLMIELQWFRKSFSPHRNNPDIQKNGLPKLDFKSNFRRSLNLTEGSKDPTLLAQTSIDKISHQFFDNAFTTFYILNQVYRRVDRNDALI